MGIDVKVPPTGEQCEFYRWLWDQPWLCGCGNPGAVVEMVIDVLDWAQGAARSQPRDLPKWHTSPAFEFVVNVLDRAGLLEHGSSVFGSWTTDEGDRRLEQLRAWGVEIVDSDDPEVKWHFATTGPTITVQEMMTQQADMKRAVEQEKQRAAASNESRRQLLKARFRKWSFDRMVKYYGADTARSLWAIIKATP